MSSSSSSSSSVSTTRLRLGYYRWIMLNDLFVQYGNRFGKWTVSRRDVHNLIKDHHRINHLSLKERDEFASNMINYFCQHRILRKTKDHAYTVDSGAYVWLLENRF